MAIPLLFLVCIYNQSCNCKAIFDLILLKGVLCTNFTGFCYVMFYELSGFYSLILYHYCVVFSFFVKTNLNLTLLTFISLYFISLNVSAMLLALHVL